MKLALLILCFLAVTFLFWVLVGLLKEWISPVRRRAQGKNTVRYLVREKHEVIIPPDSGRRVRSTGAFQR